MASAGDVLVSIGVDISDFAQQLEGMQSQFEKLGQKFSETGKTLSLAITAPLAGIGTIALKTFGDFEATMNKVNALAGLTGGEFAKLKEQALELGAKTQFSAKQAADAMAELAAAGFSASEIYKAMPGTLALAAAGQLKLGQSAEIASAILKGFGFEAGKIGDIANVLAQAANVSAASVQDLGSAFKYVGPVASAVGVSFTETSAALSILANAGIKGEMGGTALRNMLSDLIAPSKMAAAEMQKLGLQVTDANGKLLPMAKLIENLAPLQNNLAAGFKIFGVRFSEVLPLLKAGATEFENLDKSMTKASENKAAEVMAKDLFKGWNAAVESFMGSIETTLIKVGDVLAKPAGVIFKNVFEPFMNWLGDLADAFGKLPMPIQTFTLAVIGIGTAIGPVIFIAGQLMESFAALKLLGPVVQGIGGYFTNLGTVIKEAGVILSSYFSASNIMAMGTSVQTAIAGLSTSAVAGLKALPAAATAAVANFGTAFATGISGLGPKIAGMFAGLVPAITAGLGTITSAISGLSFAGMWSSIVAGFSTAATAVAGFAAIAAPVAAIVAAITAAVVAVGTAVYETIKWWDQITEVVGSFVSDVGRLFLDWVESAFGPGAASAVSSFFTSMKNAILAVPSAIRGMWSTIMSSVEDALRWMVDKAAGVAKAFNLTETSKSLEKWRDEIDKSKNSLEGLTKQAGGVGPALAAGFSFKGVSDATASIEALHKQVVATIDAVKTDVTFYGAKNAQKNADALKATLSQLQKAFDAINNAQKAHLITDQEAAALKSKLAAEVQSVKGALTNLEGQANRTGVAVENHSKKVKAVKDVYAEWKDKVQDVVEDVAKSWDEFNARLASGDNGKSALNKMSEQFRDLGREIEKTLDQNVKNKLIALQKELKTHIDQYEAWGRAIQDAKIQEQLDQMQNAINKIRATKAIENLKADFAEMMKPFKEMEDAAKTLGIEIGNVFDASQMNVWEQNLKKAQEAYKLLTDNATNLNLTEQQRQTILENLQKAQEDYNLAAIGGVEGLIKKIDELSDAFEAAGLENGPRIKWDKMVYDAEQAFAAVVNSNQASNQQIYEAWLNLQEKKVAADVDALARLIENGASLGETWGKTIDVAFKQAVIDVNRGVENMKKVINEGFQNVFTKLFEGDLRGAGEALRKFGGEALDSLQKAFLKPFQDMFTNVLSTVTRQITAFVTDQLFGNLLGGLNKVFGGQGMTSLTDLGTKLGATAKVTVAATNTLANGVQAAGNTINSAAKSVDTATGAMKQATAGMTNATNAVSTGVQTATKSIASGFQAITSVVSGAVSAVTGVLSYLQGRRMEQDIGRIEVTTREMMSQLLAFQDTYNKYLPYLDNLAHLEPLYRLTLVQVGVLESIRDAIGAAGGNVIPEVEEVGEAIDELNEGLEELGEQVENVTAGAEEAADVIETQTIPAVEEFTVNTETAATAANSAAGATSGLADAATDLTDAAGVTQENMARLVETLFTAPETLNLTHDALQKVVGSSEYAERKLKDVGQAVRTAGESTELFEERVYDYSHAAYTSAGVVSGSATMVGSAFQAISDTVSGMSNAIAGSAMALGQVSVFTTDPINALTQSVGVLGQASGAAAGAIAGAAMSLGSALVGSGAGPVTTGVKSGGGGGSYTPPSIPTTPTPTGPKADPREIPMQEFLAKGYTAGMQGPGGGIIPYGTNGQPLPTGGEAPTSTPPIVPDLGMPTFTPGVDGGPNMPSWGTPDQLWGTSIGSTPDMAATNPPIGINVNVNNADADDIAQTIVDRLRSAGY